MERRSRNLPCREGVVLDAAQIRGMLEPVLDGASIERVLPVSGGFVNAVFRVTLDRGARALALRVGRAGSRAIESEVRLLASLAPVLPVPEVLWFDGGGSCGFPYMLYPWIAGITLNEHRRRCAPADLPHIAEPLGELFGRVSRALRSEGVADVMPAERGRAISDELVRTLARLERGRARDRLGAAKADDLHALLHSSRERQVEADRSRGLVHGDFGGRNILVRQRPGRSWHVAGLLDWETATVGATLWDVGSLFRYCHRYSAEFREFFALGYRGSGADLSVDWLLAGRLLDATRLVAILDEEQDLPAVFAECRSLVRALLENDGAPAQP